MGLLADREIFELCYSFLYLFFLYRGCIISYLWGIHSSSYSSIDLLMVKLASFGVYLSGPIKLVLRGRLTLINTLKGLALTQNINQMSNIDLLIIILIGLLFLYRCIYKFLNHLDVRERLCVCNVCGTLRCLRSPIFLTGMAIFLDLIVIIEDIECLAKNSLSS